MHTNSSNFHQVNSRPVATVARLVATVSIDAMDDMDVFRQLFLRMLVL